MGADQSKGAAGPGTFAALASQPLVLWTVCDHLAVGDALALGGTCKAAAAAVGGSGRLRAWAERFDPDHCALLADGAQGVCWREVAALLSRRRYATVSGRPAMATWADATAQMKLESAASAFTALVWPAGDRPTFNARRQQFAVVNAAARSEPVDLLAIASAIPQPDAGDAAVLVPFAPARTVKPCDAEDAPLLAVVAAEARWLRRSARAAAAAADVARTALNTASDAKPHKEEGRPRHLFRSLTAKLGAGGSGKPRALVLLGAPAGKSSLLQRWMTNSLPAPRNEPKRTVVGRRRTYAVHDVATCHFNTGYTAPITVFVVDGLGDLTQQAELFWRWAAGDSDHETTHLHIVVTMQDVAVSCASEALDADGGLERREERAREHQHRRRLADVLGHIFPAAERRRAATPAEVAAAFGLLHASTVDPHTQDPTLVVTPDAVFARGWCDERGDYAADEEPRLLVSHLPPVEQTAAAVELYGGGPKAQRSSVQQRRRWAAGGLWARRACPRVLPCSIRSWQVHGCSPTHNAASCFRVLDAIEAQDDAESFPK